MILMQNFTKNRKQNYEQLDVKVKTKTTLYGGSFLKTSFSLGKVQFSNTFTIFIVQEIERTQRQCPRSYL